MDDLLTVPTLDTVPTAEQPSLRTNYARLIVPMARVFLVICAFSSVMYIILSVCLPGLLSYVNLAAALAGVIVSATSVNLTRSHLQAARICLGFGIPIILAGVVAAVGTDLPYAALQLPMILLVGILLGPRLATLNGAIHSIIFVVIYTAQHVWGYVPPVTLDPTLAHIYIVVLWLVAITVMVMVVAIYSNYLLKALSEADASAVETKRVNAMLNTRQALSARISQDLHMVTATTASAARQQASGAAEQASAVVQVTTSTEELSETATQIARNATNVTEATQRALDSAATVADTARQAVHTSQDGRQAVTATVLGIETVRAVIESLAVRLLVLSERSQRISTILDLLTTIASETHLLSLNAAIESAGAGAMGTRFSVVASEVKTLADRSLAAATDVRGMIADIQSALTSAVLAAEEGKKATAAAVELANRAGLVIIDLSNVVDLTSTRTQIIVDEVGTVVQLAEEISLATRQQQTASNQVVVALRQVGAVAHESAATSAQITAATAQVRGIAAELQATLVSGTTFGDPIPVLLRKGSPALV